MPIDTSDHSRRQPGPRWLLILSLPLLAVAVAACGGASASSAGEADRAADQPPASQPPSEPQTPPSGVPSDVQATVPSTVPSAVQSTVQSTVPAAVTTMTTTTMETPQSSTPVSPVSAGAVGSQAWVFCGQDDALLAAMDEVAQLGRGTDRFAFGAAHTAFYEARAGWRPDTPELFDATFTIRELLVDLGSVFPTTGDLPAVAAAFDAIRTDPAWVEARADVDAWRAKNCGSTASSGSGGTGSTGSGGHPTASEALAEALAVSILRGQSDLSELVDTVGEARCIAEGGVADIGVDRYDAAYGVNLRSLEEDLSMLGVVYDLIDADAIAATIADCVDLDAMLRSVMTTNEVDRNVQGCVITTGSGVELFTEMIEAELSRDGQRLDRLIATMNEAVSACGA